MISAPVSYVPRFLPLRMPRICIAIIGSDANDMIEKAETLARDNSFIEFRLDYISQPAAAIPKLKKFLEMHQHLVVVATCRRAENGGKFKGSLASQLDILGKAAAAGCQLVDVELQSALKLKPDALKKLRSRSGIVLSFHDFKATKKLEDTLEHMRAIPADFYKIVTTATTLSDNVAMMKFLETNG